MKNRIARRLTLYFALTLLLFSLVIGGVFASLFKAHTVDLYKQDMEKRAVAIASSLSDFMNTGKLGQMTPGKQGGIGTYLKYLDDIAMSDVWIVDEDLTLFMLGRMSNRNYSYTDLPPNIDGLVQDVFQENISFSQGYSSILEMPTLTVGAPITAGNTVIGALLLHAPVTGIDDAVSQGFHLLFLSLLIALVIGILISMILAYSFTQPLNKMKVAAVKLASGMYDVKTDVRRTDEIGDLANAIDTLSHKLDHASKESARLEQLRRDFVSNVSHELRTPITVIRGSLEALNDGVISREDQKQEYYRQMLKESIFLQRLVDDLLDLSRLQNHDFIIETNALNLVDVVNDAIRSAGYLAAERSIDIQSRVKVEEIHLLGDYGRLRQMLLILLDNAIKFSPAESPVVVIVDARTLTVENQGSGIRPEDLPHIFDRFYKVDSEENKTGTGLGLSIAKQIADRHGFALTVQSVPHQYTRFCLSYTSQSVK